MALLLLAWPSTEARGDAAWWDFDVGCSEDRSQTHITVACDQVFDCVYQAQALYGCAGADVGPFLVVDPVDWTDEECSCSCMISGTSLGCPPDASCPDENDYVKCSLRATTTVDVPCDEMGYPYLCTAARCAHATDTYLQYIDRECTTVHLVGDSPPAPYSGPDSGGNTGCSVAGLSPRGSCSLVLMLLLGFLALSVIATRRLQRPEDPTEPARRRPPQGDDVSPDRR